MPTLLPLSFTESDARTIAAFGTVLNFGLLLWLVLITKGYADRTKDLAETTAASVQAAGGERASRRAGLLRAVAADIQRVGGVAQLILDGSGFAEPARTETLSHHVVDLASIVDYEIFFEAWSFGENLRAANVLWAHAAALGRVVGYEREDFDVVTRAMRDDSKLIAALLITAIDQPDQALEGARALAAKRKADADARYARLGIRVSGDVAPEA